MLIILTQNLYATTQMLKDQRGLQQTVLQPNMAKYRNLSEPARVRQKGISTAAQCPDAIHCSAPPL